MKFFYDTEFLERGPSFPISLISIGIVREDGHSLYLVNADAPWHEIGKHEWLREHVVPSLPIVLTQQHMVWTAAWQAGAPVYEPLEIANAVRDFCIPPASVAKIAGPTEMWGWYADYDHVVLSQLFGAMVNLPEGMPMYTRDFKQEIDLWLEEFPHTKGAVNDLLEKAADAEPVAEHHALSDAHVLKRQYEAFADYRKRVGRGVLRR